MTDEQIRQRMAEAMANMTEEEKRIVEDGKKAWQLYLSTHRKRGSNQ